MRIIKALLTLALIAGANSAFAAPQAVTLTQHNERSGAGTLSERRWLDCGPSGTGPSCILPSNSWFVANGVTGSTATWNWDAATGVLSSTGLFWTTSVVSSSPDTSFVISDRVTNLVIDTVNDTTTASDYRCIEGNFMASIGANGCGSYSLGQNPADDSTVAYNVGGDPYCVVRTLGGDDASTGNPRGVTNFAGGGGCDPTTGAFTLWTVVQDNLTTGGTLILSNGICIGTQQIEAGCANTNYLTFAAVPVPAVGWLLAPALGALGWFRRKKFS